MQDKLKREAKQAEYDAWLRRKVEIARQDVREGRVHSSEEVEAWFAELKKKSRRKAARSGR